MIGGYDQDTRELWQIPEACSYIATWARLAGIADWREAVKVPWIENEGLAVLQQCGVFAADSPIRIRPVTRH